MEPAVKNTFLVFLDAEPELGARRRLRSAQPAFGRRSPEAPHRDEAAALAQLQQLDAIARGGATPEPIAATPASAVDAATSPHKEEAMAPRWSSFATDEGDGETPSTMCGSTSPTSLGRFGTVSDESPSLGSAGHAEGTCRPCAFARSTSGCKFGAACNFCHLVSEHPESVRMRPCKGKRERYKRTMAAIESRIAQDPDLLTSGCLNLPSFVDRSPQARERVMAQLTQVAAEAYRNMSGVTRRIG